MLKQCSHGSQRQPSSIKDLLRTQAIEHKASRIEGQALMRSPLPGRFLALLLSGVTVVACLVSIFGVYSSKVSAVGYVEPAAGYATVRALQDGVITEKFLTSGEIIEPGQKLFKVSSSKYQGNGSNSLQGWIKKIKAQQFYFNQLTDDVDNLKATLHSLQHADADIGRSAAHVSDMIGSIIMKVAEHKKEISEMHELLAAERTISRRDYLDTLVSLENIRIEGQREFLRKKELESAWNDRTRVYIQALSDVNIAKAGLLTRLFELEELLEIKMLESEHLIVAEVSAEVLEVNVSIGQTVVHGDKLLTYAQPGAGAVVELLIPDENIGDVKTGDKVRLNYRAYPRERYGSFSGVITELSKIPINSEATGEVKYKARVAIDTQFIQTARGLQMLRAGQAVDATIQIQEKIIIDWIKDYVRMNFEF